MLPPMANRPLADPLPMYVGAYWGARPESLDECARRTTAFLSRIRGLDEAFERWFDKGLSRRSAGRRELAVRLPSVSAMLAAGRNRTDFGDSAIHELGYTLSVWNGCDDSVSMSVLCGMYASVPNISNAAVLHLSSAVSARLTSSPAARTMMELLIDVWSPEWATWSTRRWRTDQGWTKGRVAGWMTYVDSVFAGRRIPDGVTAEAIGGGTLLSVAPAVHDVSMARLRRVREYISL